MTYTLVRHLTAGPDVPAGALPRMIEPVAAPCRDVDIQRGVVRRGLAFAIPEGYEIQVRPRSGLALKKGIGIPNAPGTIDSDYRGELKVILLNHGEEDFVIERGDRIAQIVVAPVQRGILLEVADLDETQRGSGGFGSTGV